MSKLDALHFIYRDGLYFWPFPQTFLLSRESQSNFLSFKKFSKLLNISCVSADMLILDFLFLEPARRRPCVGLCYYEKLLALQGRRDAEREQNETTQVSFLQPLQLCISSSTTPFLQEKRIAEEPCVGICQYYRSLGIENPYDRNIKRNF